MLNLVRRCLAEHGTASDAEIDAAVEAFRRHYAEVNGATTLYEGVVPALAALRAGRGDGLRHQQAGRLHRAAAGAHGHRRLLWRHRQRRHPGREETPPGAAAPRLRAARRRWRRR
jgi:hypothetical protein